MLNKNHSFVICAYKESPYLEACIRSLKKQTIQSNILMITSTPNQHISRIAERYRVPLVVNKGVGGITQDWNFGYAQAQTKYVTIAHQDDIYTEKYLEYALKAIKEKKKPLLFFTDYYELRERSLVKKNLLLQVKRLMLFPLRIRFLQESVWVRRRILSIGSPICCPSVLYVKDNLPKVIFQNGFRSCEDWEAWEMISKYKGSFVYEKRALMYHRIHENSETSSIIGDNARSQEEFIMYQKFWPKWFAAILNKQYAKGQKSNHLEHREKSGQFQKNT